jgi:hypothetical protein
MGLLLKANRTVSLDRAVAVPLPHVRSADL